MSESSNPPTVRIQTIMTQAEFAIVTMLCFHGTMQSPRGWRDRFTRASERFLAQVPPQELVRIEVNLTANEYHDLLHLCGYGTAAAEALGGVRARWQAVHVINQLFAAMPNFTQYEIPEEYQWHESQ